MQIKPNVMLKITWEKKNTVNSLGVEHNNTKTLQKLCVDLKHKKINYGVEILLKCFYNKRLHKWHKIH
jgi:hypothetical protein